jgi:hypothetical protein
LKALLNYAIGDPDFQTKDLDGNKALRLEVLLWGGDEMTIVVPAWQGWRVMRLFYEYARDLNFKNIPLSHRAAIIFCHHNAPILLIRQLADDLLARTRDDIKANLDIFPAYQNLIAEKRERLKERLDNHELGDAVHCLVLESFDLLQSDVENFLKNYYKGADYTKMLIYANELNIMLKAIYTIRSKIARSRALKIIEALRNNNAELLKKTTEKMISLLSTGDRETVQNAVETLIKNEQDVDRWYLVADLWDYVLEDAIS